jgi:hypothetical protein
LTGKATIVKLENSLGLTLVHNTEVMPGQQSTGFNTVCDPRGFHNTVSPEFLAFLWGQRACNNMGRDSLAIQVLEEPTTMADNEAVEVL